MAEYGHKIEEKVKAIRSEIKENAQGTNSEGKETGTRINGLDQKEEISIQPEQNEETRSKKTKTKENKQKTTNPKRGSGTSRTTLNLPPSES